MTRVAQASKKIGKRRLKWNWHVMIGEERIVKTFKYRTDSERVDGQ